MDYTRTYDDMMVYPLLNTLQPVCNMAKPWPNPWLEGMPFSRWWFFATPLKNDGVRQMGS